MLIALIQSVVCAHNEHFSPLDQRSGKKTRNRTNDDLLEKCRVHGLLIASRVPAGARALRSIGPWSVSAFHLCLPCDPTHQKPHCLVCRIQIPNSRLVPACVKTQEIKLFVRYATALNRAPVINAAIQS